jgi:hypothetical protein
VVSGGHVGGKRVWYYFANRESASAEAETAAPGNLARKSTHAALCLAGDTPGDCRLVLRESCGAQAPSGKLSNANRGN